MPLSDGTIAYRVRYRSASGAQKSETFKDGTAQENEADALEFSKLLEALGPARAVAYLDDRAKGSGEKGHAYTVDDLFALWIDWKATRKNEVRSQRTIDDYRATYERHARPAFGHKPANLVTERDIQQWVDNLDLAPKTIRDCHALIHAVFKWAVQPTRGYAINDPCAATDLPKKRKKPPKGLRPTEWAILHQAALDVDQDAADLLLFMVSTGWRFSECAAIQTMGVDYWTGADGTAHVHVTAGRVLRREGGSFEYVDDTKSEAGARRVRILPGAAEDMVLRRLHGKRPSDLLFTNRNGNRWLYTTFYERYWTRPTGTDKHGKPRDKAPNRGRILERAKDYGLDRPDLTPHWLRHTHAGFLILAGEPLPAIQRRLGHASIQTTVDVYGRMVEDASDAGLARVAAMLGGQAIAGSGSTDESSARALEA